MVFFLKETDTKICKKKGKKCGHVQDRRWQGYSDSTLMNKYFLIGAYYTEIQYLALNLEQTYMFKANGAQRARGPINTDKCNVCDPFN